MYGLKINTKKELYYTIYSCIICIIIFAILINLDTYKSVQPAEKIINTTPTLTFNVIKKIKEGKHSNEFLIQINEHDYIVIIDKNSHNTMFSHNINCRYCTYKNLMFYPYSCSVLDGYNSKIMNENENNK